VPTNDPTPEELRERLHELGDAIWAKGKYDQHNDPELRHLASRAHDAASLLAALPDSKRVEQLEGELRDMILHVRALAQNLSNCGDSDWAIPSAVNFADQIANHAEGVLGDEGSRGRG
jgi:hypothetical protein